MIDNVKVGRAIAALRKGEGLTQAELADQLFVTHQSVSKWETGAALPDINTLYAISRRFGVTLDALLAGEAAAEPVGIWTAFDMIAAFLSPHVKDLLFENALQHERPDAATAGRILAKEGLLSDEQRAALAAVAGIRQ